MMNNDPAVLGFVALRRCAADLQRSAAFYGEALGFEIVNLAPECGDVRHRDDRRLVGAVDSLDG